MDVAAKGARYAQIFRKAGLFLGRGRIAQAVKVLEEGRSLAEWEGDHVMARRFRHEIERAEDPSSTPTDSE